ncbi:N-acetyltransferase [Luteimicrobium album]|uniref:N-acetyltransferase n=1 Tax=Luteimicrobium album TaxID=1054550 RepID=A0ABQ6HZI2_9MICO|nr:GNAT family N-acetyltransferase [Luteimicrobium album]GMA23129.1 N-acetyltransferase [Luteimicrobium album]
MDRTGAPRESTVHEKGRLRLRPWHVEDAVFHRALWLERDLRVPAHRRVGADGRPTVADLEGWIRRYVPEPAPGLLVVELRGSGEPIGYCGLVANSVGRPDEPELAFEFLRSSWNQGFATEASRAMLELAGSVGYRQLASTVRDWNGASLRVLEKLGFVRTGQVERDADHGDSLLLRLNLRHGDADAPDPT